MLRRAGICLAPMLEGEDTANVFAPSWAAGCVNADVLAAARACAPLRTLSPVDPSYSS
jgi:hypothetical protein